MVYAARRGTSGAVALLAAGALSCGARTEPRRPLRVQVATGLGTTMARLDDGRAFAWGHNGDERGRRAVAKQ